MAIIRPYGIDALTNQPRNYQSGDTVQGVPASSSLSKSTFDDFILARSYIDSSNSRPYIQSDIPYQSNGTLDGAARDWQLNIYTAFTDAIGAIEIATSPDIADGYAALFSNSLVPALGITATLEFRFKILDTTQIKIFLGLASSETSHLPSDFLGYVYDSSAGTTTQSIYRLGGTNQATQALTNLNTSWHTFKLEWNDVSNTSTLYVDGSSVQTPTPNFTNPMFPCVRVQSLTGGTARRHLYLDWWSLSLSHTLTR